MIGIPRRTIHLYPGALKDLTAAALAPGGDQRALVAAFEDTFTRRIGVRQAIPTGSGRLGLRLILQAMNVRPGDEVIVPALTDESVPEAVQKAGATPIFADVDERSFNLCPERVRAVVGPRTRAIIATHIFGAPCDLSAMTQIADEHDLTIIEDCAHAIDARWQGQPCGSIGTAAIFSFVVTKAVNTFGGGMVATDSDHIARVVRTALADLPQPDRAGLLRRVAVGYALHEGTRPTVFGRVGMPLLRTLDATGRDVIGMYNRLVRPGTVNANRDTAFSPIQAAVGLSQLRQLDETQARRHAAAEQIISAMPRSLRAQYVAPGDTHALYFLVALADDPDGVARHLLSRGVDVGRHPMRNVAAQHAPAENYPGAQRVSQRGIQIPIHPTLDDRAVETIVEAVASLPR